MTGLFVIARTRTGRPTLQHAVARERGVYRTQCGVDMSRWSRAYQTTSIDEILCIRCARQGRGEFSHDVDGSRRGTISITA